MYSWIVTTTFLCRNLPVQPIISKPQTFHSHHSHRPSSPLRPSIASCVQSSRPGKPASKTGKSREINILPLEVVQRIAAGEVITGYHSVVQELVENSIDANAKLINIDIDVLTSGITVQDDGTGISREHGLADIARCNATSKLRTLAELDNGVRTLGFRGQALWAIAMTAKRLKICSRTSDSLCGTSVVFGSDGKPLEDSISPVAMAVGTIVAVTGLPWSTEPGDARKMMKRCKHWLLQAAMCYPNVKFHLTRNRKTAWRCVASDNNAKHARLGILARELRLHPSDFRSASMSIAGVGEISVAVGLPSTVHSSSKSWMITAINGRCVGIRSIRRAICAALDVRKGRYPVAFLNIATDAGLVNWNVSPMKTEMKFKSMAVEQKLVAAVPSLLRDALQGSLIGSSSESNAGETPSLLADENARGGMKGIVSLLSGKILSSSIYQAGYRGGNADSEAERYMLPKSILQARVVAQLLNTYILIEYNGGIMLIEQHVADERVIYEGLVQRWKSNRLVALKEPLKLPENIRTEWIFTLTTLGLLSCNEDDHTNDVYEVVAVPEVMSDLPKSDLLKLLQKVCREGTTIEEASASVACRLAVKNGTKLNMREMESIVRRLVRCDNGFTCPHGRPIFMELQTKELARLFGRSWTPERVNKDKDTTRTVLRSKGVLPE